jgi:aspartate kinase
MFQPGDVAVQKFGGSSMATPERILKVAERLAEQAQSGKRLAVVVSAMGDTTDELIQLVRRVSPDVAPRELDQMMATGEIVSCALMVTALQKLGIPARSFHAANLRMRTDEVFGAAEIKAFERINVLGDLLRTGGIAVVAGFQGMTPDGDFTTLGRGGSDITAVALARELHQKVCEKFTDEDGVYTADPRLIPQAKKVWHLAYDEMETLALYGNGILHPRAIGYARDSSIRIHVRSSFTREEGSVIGPLGNPDVAVKSLAVDSKQAIVWIKGIKQPFADLRRQPPFDRFVPLVVEEVCREDGRRDAKVGFRVQDGFQSFLTIWDGADRLEAEDTRYFGQVKVISLVGCGVRDQDAAGKIRQALLEAGIPVLLQEHKGLRYSVAVEATVFEAAVQLLHQHMMSGA